MRYAIIPETPDDQDLQPMAAVICRAMELPEEDAHPASITLVAGIVAEIYQAVFNAYGVRTPDEAISHVSDCTN